MRFKSSVVRALLVGAVVLVGSTTVASAQGNAAGRGSSTPARGEHRAKNATPEQKAYAKALRAERTKIRAEVKAGTADRKSAAAELKAWRAANPAPKKPTP